MRNEKSRNFDEKFKERAIALVKEKKSIRDTYWIPDNHLGRYGRWAFAELRDICKMEKRKAKWRVRLGRCSPKLPLTSALDTAFHLPKPARIIKNYNRL